MSINVDANQPNTNEDNTEISDIRLTYVPNFTYLFYKIKDTLHSLIQIKGSQKLALTTTSLFYKIEIDPLDGNMTAKPSTFIDNPKEPVYVNNNLETNWFFYVS